ncbi:transcriptional regulator [Burkholderia singularis]|nr:MULTISPECIES: TetR/AcrR family transcriptional regulator [Burkholderia]AOK31206.1 transcriptional regulator [Burkholderia sp. Bp7605]KVE28209.1 transcriptional regulator [Burkholderia singularis]
MKAEATRDLIVNSADELFYQHGYGRTSFSDIADAVKISRGNFYYHFKTKDEILDAVIDVRQVNIQSMLEEWEAEWPEPLDRLKRFANMLIVNRGKIIRSGCPVGTLCAELTKLDHVAQNRANELFTAFRAWLCEQFVLLGHDADAEADMLAMHLLSRTQGVAMLANAYSDEVFLRREVKQICEWLDTVVQRN